MIYISYNDMLQQMSEVSEKGKPIPFSLKASTSKGTFIKIERGVKNVLMTKFLFQNRNIPEHVRNQEIKERSKSIHVNVLNLDTNEIKAVCRRTIVEFNGQKVNMEL